jgi:hypothetical protein
MEFCGRDSEISEIVERWERANNNKNSSAQVVVIKGEPGFGRSCWLEICMQEQAILHRN